mgnify:FL=1
MHPRTTGASQLQDKQRCARYDREDDTVLLGKVSQSEKSYSIGTGVLGGKRTASLFPMNVFRKGYTQTASRNSENSTSPITNCQMQTR